MINVRLQGGLGNQLFQFSFGISSAQKLNCPVLFDTSHYSTNSQHGGFRLDKLNIESNLLVTVDKHRNLFREFSIRLANYFPRVMKIFGYVSEQVVQHCDNNSCYCDNATYVGYWQSEHYFKSNKNKLKELFTPRYMSEKSHDVSNEIKASKISLSIHIRRGDYVYNKDANITHGVCSLEYYNKAIDVFNDMASDINVYVFSDDISWCKNNIGDVFEKFHSVNYVSGLTQEEDLWLMSLATHHIIANSSFSWWGAWLAKSNNQIVVAPTPWYDKQPINSCDPALSDWIRLAK